jgi:hypothetical protein
MAHEKDYVPGPDAAFDGWLENLAQYVQGRTGGTRPQWGFIPGVRASELQEQYDNWHTAYAKMIGPHTAVDTEEKAEQRRRPKSASAVLCSSF